MFKRNGHESLARSRWAAVGAAVAVALGAGGAGWVAHAAPGPTTSAFVAIAPCRLFDTRTTDQVGDRATPLVTGETWVRQVWGSNGQCTIPSTATAIAYNLTVPDPTVTGFLTLYPADTGLPGSSSINPIANGGTKGNSGVVGLSATGAMAVFNHEGPVDAIVDITGYYVPGGTGAAGPTGATGPRGFSAWDTIPSGVTVTGEIIFDGQSAGGAVNDGVGVTLPGIAPVPLDTTTVNFAALPLGIGAADADATCGGDVIHPSAPSGKVCIYTTIADTGGIDTTTLQGDVGNLASRAFVVHWVPLLGATGTDEFLQATWAYTAP